MDLGASIAENTGARPLWIVPARVHRQCKQKGGEDVGEVSARLEESFLIKLSNVWMVVAKLLNWK